MLLVTDTAVAASESPLEAILALATLLSMLWAAWERIRAAKWATLFKATALGVKSMLDALPKADAEAAKGEIKKATTEMGVYQEQKEAVKKLTAEIKTVDSSGLPKLVLLGVLALGAAGCVCAAAHDSAVALVQDIAVLNRATVPSPRYSDPNDAAFSPSATAKIEALKEAVERHARALEASLR